MHDDARLTGHAQEIYGMTDKRLPHELTKVELVATFLATAYKLGTMQHQQGPTRDATRERCQALHEDILLRLGVGEGIGENAQQ